MSVESVGLFPGNCDASAHWRATTGGRRTFGVAVPVWSLRSDRDCGMGDLGDMYALVDLLSACGAGLLQILPMNDSGLDGVPYSALSAFALDPAYVALDAIPGLEHDPEWTGRVRAVAARFEKDRTVDNPVVRGARLDLLRDAFETLGERRFEADLDRFIMENPWVDTYAAFKVLKQRFGLAGWESWDQVAGTPVEQLVDSVRGCPDFRFHVFCQWLMDIQFRGVHEYARARGVLIEGDIPILVARDSADVWSQPGLFHLEFAAGAPPDMYSEDGQQWGFPTYRWDAARATGYDWWRARLRHASRYFDLYRIDHVVGFFRIWTVDVGARNGREGWFDPADENAWGEHGRTILRMMLDSTDMLPLAEDLGTIPPVCRATLREMGICGLKVQRWEKNWNTDGRFIRPADYDPLSVATLSTHDCDIAADWWTSAAYADRTEIWALMGREGEPPVRLGGTDEFDFLLWFSGVSSAFVVIALQDLMHPYGLLDEPLSAHRINLPGTVGRHNWSWRCPVSIGDLASYSDMLSGWAALAARVRS